MSGYNKVIQEGVLTRNPKLMHTREGHAVCDFGLAVTEKRKGKNETLFIDVTTFDKTAESCAEHLTKGRAVLVEGKLANEEWKNRAGVKNSRMKIMASCVKFQDTGTRGGADTE